MWKSFRSAKRISTQPRLWSAAGDVGLCVCGASALFGQPGVKMRPPSTDLPLLVKLYQIWRVPIARREMPSQRRGPEAGPDERGGGNVTIQALLLKLYSFSSPTLGLRGLFREHAIV